MICLMTRHFGCALVFAASLLPSGALAQSNPPSTSEAVPVAVAAVVSHVPTGIGRVTNVEVAEGLVERSAEAGRALPPKPGTPAFSALREVAFADRLDMVWVEGQAREMKIIVTSRQVDRRLAQIKKKAFEDAADFREFLRAYHYTRRDVRLRLRAQMLSAKIQRRVIRRAGAAGFDEFVSEYLKRWRARTVCAPSFLSERCSNGPAPLRGEMLGGIVDFVRARSSPTPSIGPQL
jgi:hypothetical protein